MRMHCVTFLCTFVALAVVSKCVASSQPDTHDKERTFHGNRSGYLVLKDERVMDNGQPGADSDAEVDNTTNILSSSGATGRKLLSSKYTAKALSSTQEEIPTNVLAAHPLLSLLSLANQSPDVCVDFGGDAQSQVQSVTLLRTSCQYMVDNYADNPLTFSVDSTIISIVIEIKGTSAPDATIWDAAGAMINKRLKRSVGYSRRDRKLTIGSTLSSLVKSLETGVTTFPRQQFPIRETIKRQVHRGLPGGVLQHQRNSKSILRRQENHNRTYLNRRYKRAVSIIAMEMSPGVTVWLINPQTTGLWKITVDGTDPVQVTVTANSSLDFSFELLDNGTLTSVTSQPLALEQITARVTFSSLACLYNVTTVSLYDDVGKTVTKIEPNGGGFYRMDQEEENTFLIKFQLPFVPFYLAVSGYDVAGNKFQRLSSVRVVPRMFNLSLVSSSLGPLVPGIDYTFGVRLRNNDHLDTFVFEAGCENMLCLKSSVGPDEVQISQLQTSQVKVTIGIHSSISDFTNGTVTVTAVRTSDNLTESLTFNVTAEPRSFLHDHTPPVCTRQPTSGGCRQDTPCQSQEWAVSVYVTDSLTGVRSADFVYQPVGSFSRVQFSTTNRTASVEYRNNCCKPEVTLLVYDYANNPATCQLVAQSLDTPKTSTSSETESTQSNSPTTIVPSSSSSSSVSTSEAPFVFSNTMVESTSHKPLASTSSGKTQSSVATKSFTTSKNTTGQSTNEHDNGPSTRGGDESSSQNESSSLTPWTQTPVSSLSSSGPPLVKHDQGQNTPTSTTRSKALRIAATICASVGGAAGLAIGVLCFIYKVAKVQEKKRGLRRRSNGSDVTMGSSSESRCDWSSESGSVRLAKIKTRRYSVNSGSDSYQDSKKNHRANDSMSRTDKEHRRHPRENRSRERDGEKIVRYHKNQIQIIKEHTTQIRNRAFDSENISDNTNNPLKMIRITEGHGRTSFNSTIQPDAIFNSKAPSGAIFNSKAPSDAIFNSKAPSDAIFNSKVPTNAVTFNSKVTTTGVTFNSKVPITGVTFNPKVPTGVTFNSTMPIGGTLKSTISAGAKVNSTMLTSAIVSSTISTGANVSSTIPTGAKVNSTIPTGATVNSTMPAWSIVNSTFPPGAIISSSMPKVEDQTLMRKLHVNTQVERTKKPKLFLTPAVHNRYATAENFAGTTVGLDTMRHGYGHTATEKNHFNIDAFYHVSAPGAPQSVGGYKEFNVTGDSSRGNLCYQRNGGNTNQVKGQNKGRLITSGEETDLNTEKEGSLKLFTSKDRSPESFTAENKLSELFTAKDRQTELFTVKDKQQELFTIKNRPTEMFTVKNRPPELLTAKDRPHELFTVKDKQQELFTAKNSPPELFTTRNRPPELFTARNRPPELFTARNRPPELLSAKNIPPELFTARNRPPELFTARNRPPFIHVHTQDLKAGMSATECSCQDIREHVNCTTAHRNNDSSSYHSSQHLERLPFSVTNITTNVELLSENRCSYVIPHNWNCGVHFDCQTAVGKENNGSTFVAAGSGINISGTYDCSINPQSNCSVNECNLCTGFPGNSQCQGGAVRGSRPGLKRRVHSKGRPVRARRTKVNGSPTRAWRYNVGQQPGDSLPQSSSLLSDESLVSINGQDKFKPGALVQNTCSKPACACYQSFNTAVKNSGNLRETFFFNGEGCRAKNDGSLSKV